MANQHFSDVRLHGHDDPADKPDNRARPAPADMPMKTANWPGLPGPKGPNRSNGVAKANTHAKSEGI